MCKFRSRHQWLSAQARSCLGESAGDLGLVCELLQRGGLGEDSGVFRKVEVVVVMQVARAPEMVGGNRSMCVVVRVDMAVA